MSAESFTFRQLRTLSPERQEQVIEVVRLRGDPVENLDDVEGVLKAHFGFGDDEEALALYAIAPGYELWAYLGEAGIVFDAKTGESTSVYCQQRHFWSVDPDDAAAVELARALNASAQF